MENKQTSLSNDKQINILLIDNESKTIEKLNVLLLNFGKVTRIDYKDIPQTATDNFNLIVLSGSSKVYANSSDSNLLTELNLIKNTNIPILGICFGFEVICRAFNCELTEFTEEQDDFRLVNIDRTFFTDAPETIAVKEHHKWGVKTVNDQLQVLGRSSNSIEIVKHIEKRIIGFQFHPELFTELTQGDDLLAASIKFLAK